MSEIDGVESRLRDAEARIRKDSGMPVRDEIEGVKKALSEDEQKIKARDVNDMIIALRSVSCRRVLARILEVCDPFADSFSKDLALMARAEGVRHVGRELLLMIGEADPAAFYQMQREKLSNDKNDQARRDKVLEGVDHG